MIDDATLARLGESVRRECRSLHQYAAEVPLWVGAEDRSVYDLVRDWADTERQQAQMIVDWLQRHGPSQFHLGQYPTRFTAWNDAAFRHALPALVREQASNLKTLEADLAATTNSELRILLEHLVALKREHASAFQTIARAAGCA